MIKYKCKKQYAFIELYTYVNTYVHIYAIIHTNRHLYGSAHTCTWRASIFGMPSGACLHPFADFDSVIEKME